MVEPTNHSRSLSLGQRILLLSAGLVVLAVGTAVLITHMLGSKVADEAVQDLIERSTMLQSTLADNRLEQLYLAGLTVSSNPNFVSYVVEAIASQDTLSLVDQLDERQRDLGFSYAIILDLEGQAVARTDQQGGDNDFSAQPVYRDAVDSGLYSSIGLWQRGTDLYYAVLLPLTSGGGLLEGLLLLAYAIDDAEAQGVREATQTEVSFLLTGAEGQMTVTASTLDEPTQDELLGLVATQDQLLTGVDGESFQAEVEVGGREYLANGKPLVSVGGERIGAVINLASLERARAPFELISKVLAGVGAGAVLIALLASLWLSKRLMAPIKQLASATDAAAEGNFEQSISGTERGDEVGQLAQAFSTLLSELREKRDMQVYLSELSRTLPDQEARSVEMRSPVFHQATLLGAELRQSVAVDGNQPRAALEAITLPLRRLSRAVMAHGGTVEGQAGHRIIAMFEGTRHAHRAMSAAADIVSEMDQVAVVAATGDTVTGSVSVGNRPAFVMTGGGVEDLEALMRVARPGSMVLSQQTQNQVASLLDQGGVPIKAHRSNVRKEPLYTLSIDAARTLRSPELTATQELSSSTPTVRDATTLAATTAMTTMTSVGVGSLLGDRFELLSELGVGGMGVVYKARDRKLNEAVALKMIKQETFAGDPAALDRLKDELKLARRITHPNVLRTYDFGEADGFPFISMEFVRGVTLKRLLDESGRLPLSAGLHMARQLCRGLAAAHAQAVLHRDIKPENLIIEPTGNVKLMDFGIAKTIQRRQQDEQRQGSLVGTPFYLAPEQLEGIEPDVRADIYACGVVFFEIFTGKLPFSASGSLMQIVGRKLNEDPALPSSFWPEIPPALERILMRCMERNREQRYLDVGSLLADLESLRA